METAQRIQSISCPGCQRFVKRHCSHLFSCLFAVVIGVYYVIANVTPAMAQSTTTTLAPSDRDLSVKPRYHRWHVDPGVEWIEENTRHAHLDWSIPFNQTALVLVDVWDRHYLKDTEARTEEIVQQRIAPLLESCRQAGMAIVHAPSPQLAREHANWIGADTESIPTIKPDVWPPPEFRSKTGTFEKFRRPIEPREAERNQLRANLKIHPAAAPVGDEPVVATGEELHQLCKRSGILFLFFAGFNTNACILTRDYGTQAMSRRGYEVILLRDCTTGMESYASQPTMSQTKSAVLFLEMFGQYTISLAELRTALQSL